MGYKYVVQSSLEAACLECQMAFEFKEVVDCLIVYIENWYSQHKIGDREFIYHPRKDKPILDQKEIKDRKGHTWTDQCQAWY